MRLKQNQYDPVIFCYFSFKGWIKTQWIYFHLFKRIRRLSYVVCRTMSGAVIKKSGLQKVKQLQEKSRNIMESKDLSCLARKAEIAHSEVFKLTELQ